MKEEQSASATVVDALVAGLYQATEYNGQVEAGPTVLLWTDENRQWELLLPRLRQSLPHLLSFGDHDPSKRVGPAIWIRCMVDRALPEADWPEDTVPIVYLPGVSRRDLRGIEEGSGTMAPEERQFVQSILPLVELQYRGTFWTQTNARDWTIQAFLQSKDGGLGLDVATDNETKAAMEQALTVLADTPVAQFQGKRLEAADFNHLLNPDPVRELLGWMNDPKGTQQRWDTNKWKAFRHQCKSDYGFDPKADGELRAAELLGRRQGAWQGIWERFAENPLLFPNLPDLLARAKPSQADDLFLASDVWPQDNEARENELAEALAGLETLPHHAAVAKIKELEKQHGVRRSWVWATLGKAPLAQALEHLQILAEVTGKNLGGLSLKAMAEEYTSGAWRADLAVLDALACVQGVPCTDAAHVAVRALYLTWLNAAAEHFQALVKGANVPTTLELVNAEGAGEGVCILFVDALRYDIGQRLRAELEQQAYAVEAGWQWTRFPSVTPTCKPAISPVVNHLAGNGSSEEFRPRLAKSDKDLTPDRFRELLEKHGVAYLQGNENGEPAGTAWTEYGALDHAGHAEGWKVAWRVEENLRGVMNRVNELMAAGWREVRVVTDHGWLLMPGGLPKAQIPSFLAHSRWGRCAHLKDDSKTDLPEFSWSWSPDVRVATPAGIGAFKAGMEYAHGGLSLQECIVPVLTVTMAAGPVSCNVTISEVKWNRLRCQVTVKNPVKGCRVDLRTNANDPGKSIGHQSKEVDEQGRAVVLVPDPDLQGTAVFVVLLDGSGNVIRKENTVIGGEK